jgi:hypothetical protein
MHMLSDSSNAGDEPGSAVDTAAVNSAMAEVQRAMATGGFAYDSMASSSDTGRTQNTHDMKEDVHGDEDFVPVATVTMSASDTANLTAGTNHHSAAARDYRDHGHAGDMQSGGPSGSYHSRGEHVQQDGLNITSSYDRERERMNAVPSYDHRDGMNAAMRMGSYAAQNSMGYPSHTHSAQPAYPGRGHFGEIKQEPEVGFEGVTPPLPSVGELLR